MEKIKQIQKKLAISSSKDFYIRNVDESINEIYEFLQTDQMIDREILINYVNTLKKDFEELKIHI